MMRNRLIGVAVLSLSILGCGANDGNGGDGTRQTTTPTRHVLLNDQPETNNAGQAAVLDFVTAGTGLVEWALANRSTTSPDSFAVAIADDHELAFFNNGQQWQAFAIANGTAPLHSSATLAAGSWHLVIQCKNLLETCQYSMTVAATY